MEDQETGVATIASLVARYLDGDFGGDAALSTAESAADRRLRRIHSTLLLLAHEFPDEAIHDVLWCPETEARAIVEAIRLRLADAAAVRVFLRERGAEKERVEEAGAAPSAAPEEPTPADSLRESEDVKQALTMLEYWTDRWLQEYHSREK